MRIGLFGQFGTGNTGNDGSLEAMANSLRRSLPDSELVCVCPAPEAVHERLGIAGEDISSPTADSALMQRLDRLLFHAPHRIRNFHWSLARTRRLDALVIPGTGILDDFCETPFGWPFVILRWCLAARINRVPIHFVSIGAGPIRHPLSRFFMKSAARMAAYRSYRDDISRDFMQGIGIDTRCDAVNCDLAFQLPVPPQARDAGADAPTIGVGVMTYSGWEKVNIRAEAIYAAYLEKMVDFVSWLLVRGLSVRLLTGDRQDRRIAEDLIARLDTASKPTDGRVTAEAMGTLHELMAQIIPTDIVVATRYHNVVCALKLGRPVISIAYAAKNDELLWRTGLSAFCHHVETLDTDRLKEDVESVLRNRKVLEQSVRSSVETFRVQLDEQERVLGEALSSPSRGTRRSLRRPFRRQPALAKD